MAKQRLAESANPIVIDESKGLVFNDENALYGHFLKEIEILEKEFFAARKQTDLSEDDFDLYEKNLNALLEDPDEVWEDHDTLEGHQLFIYLREFEAESRDQGLFHVAVVYLTDDVPSFVYLHFPTNDIALVERYQRGEIVYDRIMENAPAGALEGDALLEGDQLARGLYEAMLTIRSENDIPEGEFREYAHLREESIEEADEIWRSTDSLGNTLVSFVKDHPDETESGDLSYIVITVEDMPSNSHALLFSFPTTDRSLVDRYRHGENLQADEVVQEASH